MVAQSVACSLLFTPSNPRAPSIQTVPTLGKSVNSTYFGLFGASGKEGEPLQQAPRDLGPGLYASCTGSNREELNKTTEQTNNRTTEHTHARTLKHPIKKRRNINTTKGAQTNKQTDRQPDSQPGRQAGKQSKTQTNKQTNKQSNKQTTKQTNKQTNKQADKQTNKQTD